MKKTITSIYGPIHEYRSNIVHTLLFGSLFLAVFYAFNIYSIVSHTVAIEKIESRVTTLQSSVQKLEAQYISLSNKITPEMINHFGLHESKVSAYIERTHVLGFAQGGVR